MKLQSVHCCPQWSRFFLVPPTLHIGRQHCYKVFNVVPQGPFSFSTLPTPLCRVPLCSLDSLPMSGLPVLSATPTADFELCLSHLLLLTCDVQFTRWKPISFSYLTQRCLHLQEETGSESCDGAASQRVIFCSKSGRIAVGLMRH